MDKTVFKHIHSAQIYVSDYDRALAFYTEQLGWEKRDDAPMGGEARWLVVGIPGSTTGVSLAGPGMLDDHTPGGYTGITIVTDDIDAAYARLTAAGVRFTQPVTEMPWGDRATWFADPDDNTLYLIQTAQ